VIAPFPALLWAAARAAGDELAAAIGEQGDQAL